MPGNRVLSFTQQSLQLWFQDLTGFCLSLYLSMTVVIGLILFSLRHEAGVGNQQGEVVHKAKRHNSVQHCSMQHALQCLSVLVLQLCISAKGGTQLFCTGSNNNWHNLGFCFIFVEFPGNCDTHMLSIGISCSIFLWKNDCYVM